MSVNPLPSQPSSPLGRNRSSLLAKFRSQLGQRNRGITDYYIEPDDPWRSYFPGDVISGTIVLTVVRPVSITHLVVCLHGFVKVFKNTVPPGEQTTPDLGFLGPGRGRRGPEYLGNGLSTLFEDEVVLCGEGRLKEGIYKFRFEMCFPPYALPSSINFERGTISYLLTSTLTRPTTINPTTTCRRRVNVLENIDIAPFPPPRPRVVTLEPISRRSKSKAKAKSAGSDAPDTLSIDPTVQGNGSDHRPPLSPAPSNVSSSSRLSNSSQSFHVPSDPSSSVSTGMRNSEARSITPSMTDKIITAKAEVLRAGVLPGDTLPINVTINHCKQVRSAHGIIVTLYRQGRIDLQPAIPVGKSADGKKPVYEDYYPRSRTGLGGLTLGSSRTTGVFRKDLTQTFAPLVVDPTNLTAVVKTSIRVPEDTFPTITRTPGSMINFRYYVEVVVDLRGKLTSPDRFLPRFNMVSSGGNFSSSGQVLNPADVNSSVITANWAGNILDTDQIRREKGVVAVVFEVVIGTRDSQRGVKPVERTPSTTARVDLQPVQSPAGPDGEAWSAEQSPTPNDEGEYAQEDYGFPQEGSHWPDYAGQEYTGEPQFHSLGAMVSTPPADEPNDEKSRLRRAEQTLLPSRPPDEAGPSEVMPTAPVLPEDDLHDYHHVGSGASGTPRAVVSAESVQTVVAGEGPEEDKQELERQRLMTEASAPDEAGASTDAPTAPVFPDDEGDHQLVGRAARGDESLPRYQR
ncbi:hypothetical protein BO78DRAFT_389458 [Aspergillus sclerotiicarbonarius CBS 121057]|uniref:Arrestin C-terminal-like domain-containing protein n=1 Tax=Aspergillus sclerotiicarbonarius (strain CBS 121057 / IBT 28362) TaxID=1448318 RepID=A0A319E9W8_ASPSB|nr:hypothetical protein BO78DRAFT_389458 [Aspergillus sclerotiicarbonarius CBS 121057]